MKGQLVARGLGLALGALAFGAAHAIEVAMWADWFGAAHQPWFLNSGRAVAFTIGWMFGFALIGGLFRLSGLAIAAGGFVAMTGVLFLSKEGPGTIFPIVLAAGGLLLLFSSVIGAWIGREITTAITAER